MSEATSMTESDLSTTSSEFQRGWNARGAFIPPLSTWRGTCGHLWDRAVEDTDDCPRCELIRAHANESAGLDEWRRRAEATLSVERLAEALLDRYARGHLAFPCGEDTETEAAAILAALAETPR